MTALFYVSLGAIFGACLRYGLGLWLNPLFMAFSFGTLFANYLGCFIIGVLMGIVAQFPSLPIEWRWFLITGFLGSLTTFSSFASEVIENLLSEKWILGFSLIAMHLMGGLLCTALGFFFYRFLN